MLNSPFIPRPGDRPVAPSGRVVEFDLIRGFAARVAAAQVHSSNGLVIVGSKAIGKTTLAHASVGALSDGWMRVASIEWTDRQKAPRVLRSALDEFSLQTNERRSAAWLRIACGAPSTLGTAQHHRRLDPVGPER